MPSEFGTRPLGFKEELMRFDWSEVKVYVTSQKNTGIHIIITIKKLHERLIG